MPAWPTDWQRGQRATITVALEGAWPVHAVTVDVLGDNRPAWYLLSADARGTTTATVGPFAAAGNFAVIVTAQDELGCEASAGPRIVTIRP